MAHNPVALLDARMSLVIGLLETINARTKIIMSGTDDMATELAALTTNMTNLHAAITDIQSRLAAALAAATAAGTDPAQLAAIHAINADLANAVTSMAAAVAQPAVVVTPVP